MLGVTYNITTTCKIDGWLKSTIDKPKPVDKDSVNNKSEETLRNDSSKHDSRKGKLHGANDV